MTTAILVGNPKPKSRTYEAAVAIADRLDSSPNKVVVDLAELGAGIMDRTNPALSTALTDIQNCKRLIVASPTFKGTYTGLLKLFLDQIPPDGLAGVTAFPVMLGAAPNHALAPEVFLKPVLVEIGASCPAKGLYLLDSDYQTSEQLEKWLATASRY